MSGFAGKTVLITGAAGGIGQALCRHFAGLGARIGALDKDGAALDELCEGLRGDGAAPSAVAADIADSAAVTAAVARIAGELGPIDVLVNNAGWASFGSVLRIPTEHVERMLALNVAAPVALIQAVLPEMIDRGSGQIVNISSVVGAQAIPRMSVYSATKSALSSLSTGLRMELKGTGVDVLVVAPGSTNTPFFESAAAVDAKAKRLAETQYSPERVARAVVRSCIRRRREVTLTVEGKLITLIRRFSHRTADAVMHQVAKRAMPAVGV